MSHEPNAILAISSTDRYINYTNRSIIGRRPNPAGGIPLPIYQTNNNQPTSNVLESQWFNSPPYANDFTITAPNALINGYIDRIIISQIQLQYYVPTIIPGRNDTLLLVVISPSGGEANYEIKLPYGFFTPDELAAMLQIFLNVEVFGEIDGQFSVNYSQGNVGSISNIGFTVNLQGGDRFAFTIPELFDQTTTVPESTIFKTLKLFGFSVKNAVPEFTQYSSYVPVFLYTPYVDIYSDALTNYQRLKDTDSSTNRFKGLIARLYLSGVGNPQATSESVNTSINLTTSSTNTTTGVTTGSITGSIVTKKGNALGSEPFTLTYDMNSPKVINWTPDSAVNSLDFQVRDCYGDLLFTVVPSNEAGAGEVFNSEFQMTLLCIEG
jgi:hypothetical protein